MNICGEMLKQNLLPRSNLLYMLYLELMENEDECLLGCVIISRPFRGARRTDYESPIVKQLVIAL